MLTLTRDSSVVVELFRDGNGAAVHDNELDPGDYTPF
jgi:hypothetical protein